MRVLIKDIGKFLAVLLSAVLVVTSAFLVGVYFYSESRKTTLYARDAQILEGVSAAVFRQVESVVTDLQYLNKSLALSRYVAQGDTWGLRDLANELEVFLGQRVFYNGMIYVDEFGNEIVHIARDNGHFSTSTISSENHVDIQEYQSGLQLGPDQVGINSYLITQIQADDETPRSSYLRFSIPVIDDIGDNRGLLFLDYDVSHLFSIIAAFSASSEGSVSVYAEQNSDVVRVQPESASSVMLDGNSQTYQMITGILSSVARSGIIETSDANTLYRTLSFSEILFELMPDVDPGELQIFASSLSADQWVLVSALPGGMFFAIDFETFRSLQIWYAILVFVTALASGVIASSLLAKSKSDKERREAQEAMQASQARLQMAVDAMAPAFCIFDKEDRLLVFNDSALRHIGDNKAGNFKVGATFESIIRANVNTGFYELDWLDKESFVRKRVTRHQMNHNVMEIQFSSGRWLLIDERKTPAGEIVLLGVDITKLKETEDKLRLTTTQAEEANVAKSTFLANMSHEIRTPMNGVLGMVDVLLQNEMPPEQRQMIETIRVSSDSLLKILNDILDLSKIEAGKLAINKEPMSIEDEIGNISTLMTNVAHDKNVELSTYICPILPEKCLGDPLRLSQILTNIAGNAIKFSSGLDRPGKVSLIVESTEPRGAEYWVNFIISDNGIGMDAIELKKLFKPFEQANASTTRQFGGTGLGLVITKNLVDKMGGTISFTSEPDVGTQFVVSLPFRKIDDVGHLPSDVLQDQNCGIVGFDEYKSPVLEGYLKDAGANIHEYEDIDNALAIGLEHRSSPGRRACLVINCDEEGENPEFVKAVVQQLEKEHGKENTPVCICLMPTPAFYERISDSLLQVESRNLTKLRLQCAVSFAANGHHAKAEVDKSAEISSAPKKSDLVAPLNTTKKVLVAEDNFVNMQVIDQQLKLLGVSADLTADGEEAFEKWKQGGYAAVLTDLQMPILDGYQLTSAIREAEEASSLARVPIIAITANAMKEERERCIKLGMDDYLAKPLKLEELKVMLSSWL